MFRRIKEAIINPRNSAPVRPEGPKPVINRPNPENEPPATRYALKEGRAYRVFPSDLPESAIPTNCGQCGAPFDGLTQTNCPSCHQGRTAYMLDVTAQPYHTLPPEKEGDAPIVSSESLIPILGGGDVYLGANSEVQSAIGNQVRIETESVVPQVAGNTVFLGYGVSCGVVIAQKSLEASAKFECVDHQNGGITAKEIRLGLGATIEGRVVVPDNGFIVIGPASTIDCLIVGANSTIIAEDHLNLSSLVILGPNVKITLGESCAIDTIESDHHFQIKTKKGFENTVRRRLQDEYNLAEEISLLVGQALVIEE